MLWLVGRWDLFSILQKAMEMSWRWAFLDVTSGCWRISDTCRVFSQRPWHLFLRSAKNILIGEPCEQVISLQHGCRRPPRGSPKVCNSLLRGRHTSGVGLRILFCRAVHRIVCTWQLSFWATWLYSYLLEADRLWGTRLWESSNYWSWSCNYRSRADLPHVCLAHWGILQGWPLRARHLWWMPGGLERQLGNSTLSGLIG